MTEYIKEFELLKEKNNVTYEHCLRVERYIKKYCERYGINSHTKEILCLAGRYHDIGKIGISPEILNKVGKLSAEEQREVEDHPFIGYIILRDAGLTNKELLKAVLDHHEKLDGSGYSNKKNISLVARIIKIADEVDTKMDPHVLGETAKSIEQTILELRETKGLDQEVVEKFIELIKV